MYKSEIRTTQQSEVTCERVSRVVSFPRHARSHIDGTRRVVAPFFPRPPPPPCMRKNRSGACVPPLFFSPPPPHTSSTYLQGVAALPVTLRTHCRKQRPHFYSATFPRWLQHANSTQDSSSLRYTYRNIKKKLFLLIIS